MKKDERKIINKMMKHTQKKKNSKYLKLIIKHKHTLKLSE